MFLPGSRWDGQSRNQNPVPGTVDYNRQAGKGGTTEAEATPSHSVPKQHDPIWPVSYLLSLSHRSHAHNADTCMQGFPNIICPAFCSASAVFTSFLTIPEPIRPQINTNMQPCTNICTLMLPCCPPNSFIIRFIPCWCCFTSVHS